MPTVSVRGRHGRGPGTQALVIPSPPSRVASRLRRHILHIRAARHGAQKEPDRCEAARTTRAGTARPGVTGLQPWREPEAPRLFSARCMEARCPWRKSRWPCRVTVRPICYPQRLEASNGTAPTASRGRCAPASGRRSRPGVRLYQEKPDTTSLHTEESMSTRHAPRPHHA
jgi:hypothetical protein